ncbi:putative Putrescine transport system permease protein PotH [Anopheles sinensis]|uniref:Putative Putrescine transport system permease protein PotH n=1 Tax=Anopheles sinensis TaxID=74873 RepID=A0A084WPE6_ANOSI|nr:putative Putrescine transport system permease protein PotH [Anopheles sinensis]
MERRSVREGRCSVSSGGMFHQPWSAFRETTRDKSMLIVAEYTYISLRSQLGAVSNGGTAGGRNNRPTSAVGETEPGDFCTTQRGKTGFVACCRVGVAGRF